MMPIYCCFIHYRLAHGRSRRGKQIAERGLRSPPPAGLQSRRLDPLARALKGCSRRINRDNPDKAITALYDAIFPVFILLIIQRRTGAKTRRFFTNQANRAAAGNIFRAEYLANIHAAEEGAHIIIGGLFNISSGCRPGPPPFCIMAIRSQFAWLRRSWEIKTIVH